MRVEVTETKLYTFDELSDDAKERAREWYRGGIEADQYSECVLEDATRIGALIGIDIATRPVKLVGGGTRMEPNVDWDLGNGGGVSVAGSYSYRKGGARAVARERPGESKSNIEINRIAEALQEAQRQCFYTASAQLAHGRYCNQLVEVWDDEGNDLRVPGLADEIVELLRDFAAWIYASLQAELDYQMSDEVVEENIEANEYEFTEEGKVTR